MLSKKKKKKKLLKRFVTSGQISDTIYFFFDYGELQRTKDKKNKDIRNALSIDFENIPT